MKQLTQEQVIELMRKKQGDRMAKDYAAELGISRPYLSDIYAGKREPGPTVLAKLGLEKIVIYRQA
jgi:transcriptional regulator with XRE-family HTH domain